jgi:hypothetical protein
VVERRQEHPVGVLVSARYLGSRSYRRGREIVVGAVPDHLQNRPQDRNLARTDFEGDGSTVPRRVLISHEEPALLVVRPSVGVTAPAEGRFVFARNGINLGGRTLQASASLL